MKLEPPISLDKFMHPKQAEYQAKLQDKHIRREIRNEGYLAGVYGHPLNRSRIIATLTGVGFG